MPAIRAFKSHGPNYYRQLLERPEGAEILKPNRAVLTLKMIRSVRTSWQKCGDIIILINL